MTDQQVKDHIAALLRERDECLRNGETERAAAVDKELRNWAPPGAAPAKRATRR